MPKPTPDNPDLTNINDTEVVTKLIITALQTRAEQQSPSRANPYRVLATSFAAGSLTVVGTVQS